MATPLLKTKLYIPPVRPELVPRPRLIERLNAGLGRKLTLISAPAGFGKTTLLSHWLSGIGSMASAAESMLAGKPGSRIADNRQVQVAWLSLDDGDNDPTRFLAYFIAVLQAVPSLSEAGVGVSILAALESPGFANIDALPVEPLLTGLVNEIAVAGATPLLIALDDYHVIKTQPVHDTLTFLLDHMPPNMHLVIASRADPPLPLARLRAQAQLVELRQSDLCFTDDEAAEFLERVLGRDLAVDDVAALASRTEGWIAGLQMAAVSIQGQEDVSAFIRAFTGSDRHILDYLVEEVLQRQPESIQTFLLRTSILDRLSGPLCDTVVGLGESANGFAPSSQELLEHLERNNLFIVSMDNERRWYRYHRLFADLLLRRLRRAQPDLVPALYCRASRWYEQNGWMPAAVEYALSAPDFERAADLVEDAAQATLTRSEVVTFLRWVAALPEELVLARPALCLSHAWALLLSGRPIEAVESRLQGLDARVGPGKVATLRARVAALQGRIPHAVELASQALDQLPEDDAFSRSMAIWTMGIAHWAEGDVGAGRRALEEAVRLSQQAGNIMVSVMTLSRLAGLRVVQGQLYEARAMYEQALALATDTQGRRLPVAGEALIGLGELAREWNELEAAAHYLAEGIELANQWGEFGALGGYLGLAGVRQAQGDIDAARDMLLRARQLAAAFDAAEVDDLTVSLAEARLSTLQGDIEATTRWVEERKLTLPMLSQAGGPAADAVEAMDADFVNYHLRKYEYVVLARVLIAQGQTDEALALLEWLLPVMERRGRPRGVIEIQVLRALVYQTRGDVARAMDVLERALSMAQPGGYVRVFVDEGPSMGELLQQAASRSIAPEYVRRLLAALGPQVSGWDAAQTVLKPETQLVEPLSERELQILRLLTTHLSSTEIAEKLIISANTVRYHIKNIYGKLGVHSRSDAVYRADELGLL